MTHADPTPTHKQMMVLMFTDIVGSVQMKARLGNKAVAVLIDQHDRLFALILESISGAEILKDVGDGFLARFRTSSDAVSAALQFQHSIHRGPWDSGAVSVRIGIHVGEVEEGALEATGRPKLVGLATDIAARVMSLARGGQILMTRTVFDDARMYLRSHPTVTDDAPCPELKWLAHGPYLVAGYDEPLEMFEVGVQGVAPLAQPEGSTKVRRATRPGDEETLGWRPAVGLVVPDRPNWVLQEKLGEGGFGEVWLGLHPKTKDRRVFKFCMDPERLRGLKREVVLFRLLKETLGNREDIVRILDWQFDRPPFYLESEYTPGGSLVQWAERQGGVKNVDLKLRLELVVQIAEALGAAHTVGVIHKDIKPANILIDKDDSGRAKARLADFGIGLVTDRKLLAQRGITATGLTQTVMGAQASTPTGTQKYIAPELLEGRPATTLSDLYSLGIVLYQLVVGDLGRVLAVGWEREVNDELLREDIAACVEGIPKRRMATAGELANRLRNLETRHAELDRRREQAISQARSRRARRILSTALAGFAIIFGVLSWSENRRATNEKQLRAEADESRRLADVEAETSAKVTEFLVELFEISDPWAVSEEGTPRGETVTVREILDRGAIRIREELSDQPEVQSALMFAIGRVYQRLGLYGEARELLEDSLALRRSEDGRDSAQVATGLDHLAEALRSLDKTEEAESVVSEALGMRRRLFGDVHLDVALSLDLLGRLQRDKREYDAADKSHREELAIVRKLLGDDDPKVALAMLNLAIVRRHQGDFDEAESLLRGGLEIQLSAHGDSHPDVARVLNGLGVLMKRKGEYLEAEELYLRALKIHCELLPENHPSILMVKSNLMALALEMARNGDIDAFTRIRAAADEIENENRD